MAHAWPDHAFVLVTRHEAWRRTSILNDVNDMSDMKTSNALYSIYVYVNLYERQRDPNER